MGASNSHIISKEMASYFKRAGRNKLNSGCKAVLLHVRCDTSQILLLILERYGL